MITLTGTLAVRVIKGRNGEFAVGSLTTEVGEFAIKDPLLDQYEPGSYRGEFTIERIFPTHYMAGNRITVELRAKLFGLELIESSAQVPPTPEEPDPLDTDATPPPAAPPEAKPPKAPPSNPPTADSPLAGLFGALWPLGPEVVLDPTVDRRRFREQRDHLKASGYQFDAGRSLWIKP